MFDLERWQEIFETIRKNKLRTFLTGLSVASGIFILVILLGVGQGMQNGISRQFQNDAKSRISVYTGVTSVEYKGMNPGRLIQLENADFNYVSRKYADQLDRSSALYRIWGGVVSFKDNSGSFRVEGVLPDKQFIENEAMLAGRFLNSIDQNNYHKVVVIGNKVKKDLFKNGENPIGQMVDVSGLNFKVIGVFSDPGGDRQESRVFIPLSTAQRVFNAGEKISRVSFTLPKMENFDKAVAVATQLTADIESQLKTKYTIAPSDNSAIGIINSLEGAKKFYSLMSLIKWFFWGVGIATIFAGIVGVSNIMLIIVKERTKEIGIRKALGAQPISIIGMVLHEAIFVTLLAGFTGLIAGLFLLEFVGPMIQTEFITNPNVNFNVALTTVFILVFAGALAGFFPAWRAARIKPIVALRDE